MAETMNWAEMLARYKGLWVALKDRNESIVTVLATNKKFEEAEAEAKKNGCGNPWVVFVQERNTLWIGGGYEIELSDVQPSKEV